jgi:uncharacterized OB-fold protein
MRLGRGWARLVAKHRERKQQRRRDRWMRGRRTKLTWQTCRRCGSCSFLPAKGDQVCQGCLSLQ